MAGRGTPGGARSARDPGHRRGHAGVLDPWRRLRPRGPPQL